MSKESLVNPVTPGHAIDSDTELSRHCSRALAFLTFEEVKVRPITPGQVIDLTAEIQRHCSRAVASLMFDEAKKLHDHPVWLDMWLIASLRLRGSGLIIGVHPQDENKESLLRWLSLATKGNRAISDKFTLSNDPLCITLLLVSQSHLLPTEFSTDHDCFHLLVEANPMNSSLLGPPTVFWVKPSDCPSAIALVISRLLSMR